MPSVSWTLPEKDYLRKQVTDFLQFNQTNELKLYGGCLETIRIDTLHTKSL